MVCATSSLRLIREKYGHLAYVATNPAGGVYEQTEVTGGHSGLSRSLVYPWRKAFAPRVGFAWRVPKLKQTVVRAGFGMNYTVGEYATFATKMAHQPPFTNQQTNQEASGNTASSACARTVPMTCFTLANGFPAPATLGNYRDRSALSAALCAGVERGYSEDAALGHCDEPWLQRNARQSSGYSDCAARDSEQPWNRSSVCNGSLGCYPLNFTYDEAVSFSKFNAGTVRVNKRIRAEFRWAPIISTRTRLTMPAALGGVGGVGVQDWQNVLGELGNSSLDVRHTVSGTYLYELPFGKDKYWVTTGAGSHILEGFSVSGTFKFATGRLAESELSGVGYEHHVRHGRSHAAQSYRGLCNGRRRIAAQWFNPAAYSAPTNTPGYCNFFGNAPRNSIEGPGTVSNNMSLSKTMQWAIRGAWRFAPR